MLIQVSPGGLDSPGFQGISQDVVAAIAQLRGGLTAAAGGAGNAALAGAISDLLDAVSTADRSATLSLNGLGVAVAKAGEHYTANDSAIANAARAR